MPFICKGRCVMALNAREPGYCKGSITYGMGYNYCTTCGYYKLAESINCKCCGSIFRTVSRAGKMKRHNSDMSAVNLTQKPQSPCQTHTAYRTIIAEVSAPTLSKSPAAIDGKAAHTFGVLSAVNAARFGLDNPAKHAPAAGLDYAHTLKPTIQSAYA